MNLVQVDFEDISAAVDIWLGNGYFLVKPTGADRSRIQILLVIRCANHHDIVILLKTVHFGKHGIYGGAAGAVLTPEPSAFGQKGVNLIDENYAGFVFSGFFEQLADAFCPDTHIHFIEGRSCTVEKSTSGFA